MPAARTFNPPPNWPAPPPGWKPPPGWEPDPEWGPPPPGWELFPRANPHPFRRAFTVAAVALAVVAVAAAVVAGGLSANGFGQLIAIFLVPAVIVGFVLRLVSRPWPWWKLTAVVLALTAVFGGVRAATEMAREVSERPTEATRLTELPKEEARLAARKANAGVLTDSETDCLIDRLLERPELTVGQINDYVRTPTAGPVEKAYQEIMPGCIDRNAVVPPAPLPPELRQAFLAGLRQGAPELTQKQAECVLADALRRGVTPRQIALSGYDKATLDKIVPVYEKAFRKCT